MVISTITVMYIFAQGGIHTAAKNRRDLPCDRATNDKTMARASRRSRARIRHSYMVVHAAAVAGQQCGKGKVVPSACGLVYAICYVGVHAPKTNCLH